MLSCAIRAIARFLASMLALRMALAAMLAAFGIGAAYGEKQRKYLLAVSKKALRYLSLAN